MGQPSYFDHVWQRWYFIIINSYLLNMDSNYGSRSYWWMFPVPEDVLADVESCADGLKLSLHLNTNAARENKAVIQCRCVTEARQTAFGCARKVQRIDECYPSTIGTSKRIRIQYAYVGLIRCLGKYRTVNECTICSTSPFNCIHRSHSDVNPALRAQYGFTKLTRILWILSNDILACLSWGELSVHLPHLQLPVSPLADRNISIFIEHIPSNFTKYFLKKFTKFHFFLKLPSNFP